MSELSIIESIKPEPRDFEAWREFMSDILPDWFSVTIHGDVARVFISGEIGLGRHWRELIKQVAAARDIQLFIDSPGGDMIAGVELYKAWRGRVSVATITDKCFSAALPIALAGAHIRMERKSKILCHAPVSFAFAEAMGFLVQGKLLHDLTDQLRKIIIERAEVKAVLAESWLNNHDIYLSAEQAKALALINEIYDAPQPVKLVAPPVASLAPAPDCAAEPMPSPLVLTEDESLFHDLCNAFGDIRVHNLRNFQTEVLAWSTFHAKEN